MSGQNCAKWPKIAKNAHTEGWDKCGKCPTLTGVRPKHGLQSFVSNTSLGCRQNLPAFGNDGVHKWAHDLGLTQISHKKALMCLA